LKSWRLAHGCASAVCAKNSPDHPVPCPTLGSCLCEYRLLKWQVPVAGNVAVKAEHATGAAGKSAITTYVGPCSRRCRLFTTTTLPIHPRIVEPPCVSRTCHRTPNPRICWIGRKLTTPPRRRSVRPSEAAVLRYRCDRSMLERNHGCRTPPNMRPVRCRLPSNQSQCLLRQANQRRLTLHSNLRLHFHVFCFTVPPPLAITWLVGGITDAQFLDVFGRRCLPGFWRSLSAWNMFERGYNHSLHLSLGRWLRRVSRERPSRNCSECVGCNN